MRALIIFQCRCLQMARMIVALLLCSSPAFSTAEDSLKFDIELVNIASQDPEISRLDVYVRIIHDNLQFIKTSSDSFKAEYVTKIQILSTGGEEVESREFENEIILGSLDEANDRDKFRLNHFSFELPPGAYTIDLSVEDLETRQKGDYSSEVSLKKFPDEGMYASDLLFLADAEKSGNGMVTWQPRVSDLQNQQSRILMYFEVYNVPAADSFSVQYEVTTVQNSTVLSYEYREVSKGRVTQNVVDMEGDLLAHGQYVAKVRVSNGDESLEFEKPFNWFLAGLPLEFGDIDKALEVLKYVASEKEYETLLGLSGRDKYVGFVAFWKKHDHTPTTPENDLRDVYYERVAFANEKYGTVNKKGWRTDRGWAYVMLGAPDIIEQDSYNQRFSQRAGKTVKAILVWVYYKYNRQLTFFDTNGFGEYRLENPDTLYEITK